MVKKLLIAIVCLLVVAVPLISSAVTINPNLGSTLTLGTADLESTVIKIIQWALGFLGLIAVIMIIYGGFMLLTVGQGNADRAASSKTIIIAASVGLVIILIAWSIVTFVVKTTTTVTQ